MLSCPAYYQDLAGTSLGFARQLAARVGRYLETLLADITAGVVSADAQGRVTTMNRAAESLLGVPAGACVGRVLDDAFADERYAEIRQLAAALRDPGNGNGEHPVTVGGPLCRIDGPRAPGGSVERQFKLERDGQEMSLLLTGTRLLDDAGGVHGLVLFLEEVTHLLRVQRMEAWREVARRIAHEIKNPLTPSSSPRGGSTAGTPSSSARGARCSTSARARSSTRSTS